MVLPHTLTQAGLLVTPRIQAGTEKAPLKWTLIDTPLESRFRPAAMTTILPVFCELHRDAVAVLPSIENDVTDLGGTPPTTAVPTLILLSTTSGEAPELKADTLCTQNPVLLEFGLFRARMVTTFGMPLVNEASRPSDATPRLLGPIVRIVFMRDLPPRPLKLIMIILLSTTSSLGAKPMETNPPLPIIIAPPRHLIHETANDVPPVNRTANTLLILATILPRALSLNMAVLTIGLLPLLFIHFPTLVPILPRRSLLTPSPLVVAIMEMGNNAKVNYNRT